MHFAFSPPSLDVLAGELGRARLRIEAPPPPAGQEASRALTVLATSPGTAGSGGHRDVRADHIGRAGGHAADRAAGSERRPGPGHRRRAAGGDHRQPRRHPGPRRVFLSGRDPERLVRFTFSPPSLDVLAGDIGRVRVRLEAPLPEPGQEATRQITVVAADGAAEIEASRDVRPGHLAEAGRDAGRAQARAEPDPGPGHPVRTVPGDRRQPAGHPAPPGDPGRHRSRTRHSGSRSGRRSSTWTGDRSPGRPVRIDAYPPEPGREVTRQFSVSASDGAKEVETDGTFIQSTSPPPPDEPMTMRLEPSVVRVRNSGTGIATVVRRQPRRIPAAAGAVRRARPGTGGAIRLQPAGHRPGARAERRGPGADLAPRGRTAARRSPGRSPSSPPTAPRTPRRPAASSRSRRDRRPMWRIAADRARRAC